MSPTQVKRNWIGPKATIITQATTEMELSRMTWDEPIILDCLDPIWYELPVCRNGFLISFPSSLSSLKLISLSNPVARPPCDPLSQIWISLFDEMPDREK
jgi:hypothetical protein